jgi:hypothetical protein
MSHLPPLAPTHSITKVKFSDEPFQSTPLPSEIFEPPIFDNRRKLSQERFYFDNNSPVPMLLNPRNREIDFDSPDRGGVPSELPSGTILEEEEPISMFSKNLMLGSPEQNYDKKEEKVPIKHLRIVQRQPKQSRPVPKISIFKRSENEMHILKLSENAHPKVKRLIKKINLDDL